MESAFKSIILQFILISAVIIHPELQMQSVMVEMQPHGTIPHDITFVMQPLRNAKCSLLQY